MRFEPRRHLLAEPDGPPVGVHDLVHELERLADLVRLAHHPNDEGDGPQVEGLGKFTGQEVDVGPAAGDVEQPTLRVGGLGDERVVDSHDGIMLAVFAWRGKRAARDSLSRSRPSR